MRIRPRADADLPELVAVLGRQQPLSRYPVRWPPPFPVVDFIKRPGELGAWVAEADDTLLGHVSAMQLPDEPLLTSAGDEVSIWTAGTGLPPERLASMNALFVDPSAKGRGVGAALHDAAVAAIQDAGLIPVLDVVSRSTAAIRLYERRGWRVIGSGRPEWLPDDWDPVLYMCLD